MGSPDHSATSDPINPTITVRYRHPIKLDFKFFINLTHNLKMQSLIQVNKRLENERLITRLTKISGSSPTSLKDRYMVNAARLRLQLCSLQSALEAKSQAWAHAPEFVPRSNSMSSSDTGNGLNVSATPFVMSNTSSSSSSCSDSEDESLTGIAAELQSVLSRPFQSTPSKKRRKQKRRGNYNYRNKRS